MSGRSRCDSQNRGGEGPSPYHRGRSHRQYSARAAKALAAEIDLGSFALPPVFTWLQREARLDQAEMLRTFNCGIGMILVTAPRDVKRVLRHLGDEAIEIGAIVKRGRGERVRYARGTFGEAAP